MLHDVILSSLFDIRSSYHRSLYTSSVQKEVRFFEMYAIINIIIFF